jgi:hypothetical protein
MKNHTALKKSVVKRSCKKRGGGVKETYLMRRRFQNVFDVATPNI